MTAATPDGQVGSLAPDRMNVGDLELFRFSILVIAFSVLALSIVNRIPGGDTFFSSRQHQLMSRLLPQRWAFFTDSPKDDHVNFYRVEGKVARKIDFRPFQIQYLLGFDKSVRVKWFALSKAANGVPEQDWVSKHVTYAPKLIDVDGNIKAIDIETSPDLFPACEGMIMLKQSPVPLGGSANPYDVIVTTKMASIKVNCNG